jgi:hypothetical protein
MSRGPHLPAPSPVLEGCHQRWALSSSTAKPVSSSWRHPSFKQIDRTGGKRERRASPFTGSQAATVASGRFEAYEFKIPDCSRIIAIIIYIGFAIVILKSLVVTNFNSTSTLALVTTAGIAQVILGIVVSTLPYLSCLALLFLSRTASRLRHTGDAISAGAKSLMIVLAAALVVLAFVMVPWPFLLLTGLTAIFLFLQADERSESTTGQSSRLQTVAFYVVAAIILLGLLNRWMWLPSEEIGLNSGQVVVGFVLDDDGDWGSLLRDRDHTIMRIKTDTIETRMICQFRSTSPAVRASMLRIIATWVGRPISSKVPFCQSPNQSSGGLAAFSPVG